MNNTMRNLTLSAAALAALMVVAPKAAAQPWKGFPLPPSPHQVKQAIERRHDSPRDRGHAYGNNGRDSYGRGDGRGANGYGGKHGAYGRYGRGYSGGYPHRYVVPVRPNVRYGYGSGYGYGAGYRSHSRFRFYSSRPGPGYVYIADLGWGLPPFAGAAWDPGYYDDEGLWIEGCWR